MEANLLDRMLNAYLEAQTPVTVTLQNKIRVSGRISAFDSYVIVVDGQKREIIYRHAVSCIVAAVPRPSVRVPENGRIPATRPARPAKEPSRRTRPAPAPTLVAASAEASINTSMKEGLLRWMQEQKSVK